MLVTDGALSERAAPGGTTQRQGGLARERVVQIQRARMLAAMTQLACENGVGNVTVADVVARSGVSRRTFYEVFEDRTDCLLAALDEGVAGASRYVSEVWDSDAKWVDRVRVSLLALLRFLEVEPAMGRLVIVESFGAGPASFELRSRVMGRVIYAIDEGRVEAPRGTEISLLTAEGVVGAVLSVLHGRMLDAERGPFTDLLNPLMAMIVQPYRGVVASRRELSRAAPKVHVEAKPVQLDPFAALEMRLTYRTMRVLQAVGLQPGSSNREVAQAAEVADPGQMSKLLARLDQLGLIENSGRGKARGEPNAWQLTAKGREVESAIAGSASYG